MTTPSPARARRDHVVRRGEAHRRHLRRKVVKRGGRRGGEALEGAAKDPNLRHDAGVDVCEHVGRPHAAKPPILLHRREAAAHGAAHTGGEPVPVDALEEVRAAVHEAHAQREVAHLGRRLVHVGAVDDGARRRVLRDDAGARARAAVGRELGVRERVEVGPARQVLEGGRQARCRELGRDRAELGGLLGVVRPDGRAEARPRRRVEVVEEARVVRGERRLKARRSLLPWWSRTARTAPAQRSCGGFETSTVKAGGAHEPATPTKRRLGSIDFALFDGSSRRS